MNETNLCSVCKLGDGKWEEGRNLYGCRHLPVCELCKQDGWSIATSEAITKDPTLKEIVHVESPFSGQ